MDFIEKSNTKPYMDFFFIDRKDLILNSFKFGTTNHYKIIVQEFFNLLDEQKDFTPADTKRIVLGFALVVNNISWHLGTSVEQDIARFYKDGCPDIPPNHVEWLKKFITFTLDRLYNKIYMNRQEKNKKQVYWIKSYIDSHYDEDISLNYFEETCYLCKEYLLKLFKKAFGYTIYEYTLKLRMERAKEMLLNGRADIKQISSQVGFNDSGYFCKSFKKYYGVSPSDYRNLNAEEEKKSS